MVRICSCLLCITIIISCRNAGEGYKTYKEQESRELKRNVREDSLFFGIYMGMTSKDFFLHCWELNKKGLFTDGLGNSAVLYKLDSSELGHAASMNFYPDFDSNRIFKMRVSFRYDAWAPWNRYLYSDSLFPRVVSMYERWYNKGNPFLRIEDKQKGTIYIKVDGNRRIIIGKGDEMNVRVEYTDLFVEQQLEKLKKKTGVKQP